MPLKESGEMYLESIYILCKSKSSVRSFDVAEYMNFSTPSVSRGVGIFKKRDYITVDKDGYIFLTQNGKEAAERIFERHTVLTAIFKAIGVDEKIAAEDACRIEHVISDDTFKAIKKFYQKMKST